MISPFPRPAAHAAATIRETATSGLDQRGFKRLRFAGVCLLIILFVGAVVTALVSTGEALEERRSEAAASELRLASMIAGNGAILASFGGDVELPQLESSMVKLSGNHDQALHSLTPADTMLARDLLDDIVVHDLALLNFDGIDHAAHGHDINHLTQTQLTLDGLLGLASSESASDANAAEQWAKLAAVAAALLAGFGAWLLVRSRHQIERQKARSEAHEQSRRLLESVLDDSPEIFLVVDQRSEITYRSASADRLLGTGASTREDIVALADVSASIRLRKHLGRSDAGAVSEVFELTGIDGDAGLYGVRVSDLTDDGTVDGHLITARDITDEVRLREKFKRLANTDALTGLPNRRVLPTTLDDARNNLSESGDSMALMILDIDEFKKINDTLGHLAGDQLLTSFAARLSQTIGPDDVLLRLGGDEFAVVFPTVKSELALEQRAQRLIDVLGEPFQLGERTERVRTSVGLAATADPRHVDDLLGEADIAMYEAKRDGGATFVMYEPGLGSTSARAALIATALHDADFDTELSLLYQPIVTADTTELVGIEALLQWNSPTIGTIAADEFMPIAESCGEFREIGRWVVNTICRQLAAWIASGSDSSIAVWFDVSSNQLAQDDFVAGVLTSCRALSIPPERLVVEVTESTALDPSGLAIVRLKQLRQARLGVAIDQFGSGSSNVGRLLRVPFDHIKIDASALSGLTILRERAGKVMTEPCTVMRAIVSLAGTQGARVVCEGVDTEVQRTSLQASGVSYIQGGLTGEPVPADAIAPSLHPTTLTSAHA